MNKTNIAGPKQMKVIAYLMLTIGFTSVLLLSWKSTIVNADNKNKPVIERGEKIGNIPVNNSAAKNIAPDADKIREEESKQAFLEAYKVFMHPRCMNCHPAGDIPLQGDDSRLHAQGVKRGKDGKGLYAMKCKNCHQDTNLVGENLPPGHPNWHLPPANRKMVFEGKSPRQLAMGFKDAKFTGFSTMEKFLHHVEHDDLVKNSFTYGEKPPLSHEEFAAKVREWVEKGAALPD